MFRQSKRGFCVCLFSLSVTLVHGQNNPTLSTTENRGLTEVAAAFRDGKVRFAAIGIARQMRLEVLDQIGNPIYNSGFRDGTLIDWKLEDEQMRRITDGIYGCIVTVEDLAGLQSRRTTLIGVTEGAVRFTERVEIKENGVHDAERDDSVTVLLGEENLPVALLAHDGRSGVVAGGKGGLSFRAGDLLAGKDVEHVRLTSDGRLGVGTAEPKARLDVAGLIRTSEGIQFPDGTIQRTAAGAGAITAFPPVTSFKTGSMRSAFPSEPTTLAEKLTAAGRTTGRIFGSEGTTNTFYGSNAGVNNTNGAYNSFFGASAGYSNTGGDYNAFFGRSAGYHNTTDSNSFFGYFAGYSTSTGGSNSFFGRNAGSANTTGANNTFVGREAGRSSVAGSSNSFFGTYAGFSNTAGSNSFFGSSAGYSNTSGSSNSFFGMNAGRSNTTGGANSFLGFEAGYANTTGSHNSFFGRLTGHSNTTGIRNSFFGNEAGHSNTTGSSNSFFGDLAGYVNTTGANNSFFGNESGAFNTTGSSNSYFGSLVGRFNSTGSSNSFFGREAGYYNTSGSHNSFFGLRAGFSNTQGVYNAFFGDSAGNNNTAGNFNSFFGGLAGISNTSGVSNTFIGGFAGYFNALGEGNSFVGSEAGMNNTSGSFNTFLGRYTGSVNTTEHNNTYLGAYSNGATAIANATAVGYRASVTQSDSIVLGSINGVNGATADTNVGIGTTTPAERLHVVGNIRVSGGLITGAPSEPVPDYVFEPSYRLRPIEEVAAYIERERHLPEVPKASEIQRNGVDLGSFQMKLLQKIEELTLYAVEQARRIRELEMKLAALAR